MKLSTKMTLGAVMLLTFCLCAAGLVLNAHSFSQSLASAVLQSTARHDSERYALEQQVYAELANTPSISMALQNAALRTAREQNTSGGFAVYQGKTLSLFSNLPPAVRKTRQIETVADIVPNRYRICEKDGARCVLLATPLALPGATETYTLLSAYDITDVFRARTAQLWTWCAITAAVLAASAGLVYRFSRRLTRPLEQLQQASGQIAQGDYALRTAVATGDEIGALSRSFDAMADAVQQQMEALRETARRQMDFVAAFTHEIKTPMTSMMGYAGLLRAGRQTEEVRLEAATYLYHETKRLESLSQHLLALLGLQEGEAVWETVLTVPLLHGLERSLPGTSSLCAPAAQRDVPITFSAQAAAVRADRLLLDDLLRNLILNAKRACRDAGSVEVSCRIEQDTVVFTVQDTGCGIPPEELPHITEPFYMVDKSRARAEQGSGIGLALCNRIAQMHNTALEFESAPGVGTTVTVRLQKMEPPQDAQADEPTQTGGA